MRQRDLTAPAVRTYRVHILILLVRGRTWEQSGAFTAPERGKGAGMPTRTINLKFILDRSDAGQSVRQDLWTTHASVNEGVAQFEKILLLCRGQGYLREDDETVSAEAAQREALSWARHVQKRNRRPGAGSDRDVLGALRQFYEALVRAAVLDEHGHPLKGDARQSRGFAGPMMDPASTGGTQCLDKVIEPLPGWVAKLRAEEAGWEAESAQWLQTPDAQRLLGATGRAPKWKKLVRQGEPWQQAFLEDQKRQRREARGSGRAIYTLKHEFGLLPMLSSPIAGRLTKIKAAVSRWDYMALRLAVAHLLSWEAWNHRAWGEYREREHRRNEARARLAGCGSAVERLREYERQRHAELKRVALADDSRPYRIMQRSIRRAWERVRARWLAPACRSESDRVKALNELQAKLSGSFGDPDLFRWLARDENVLVWCDGDPLPDLVALNVEEDRLSRKRQQARHTPADARLHPRWVQYENSAQSGNLPLYGLRLEGGRLAVEMPLLRKSGNQLEETRLGGQAALRLAPSGQLAEPRFAAEDKRQRLAFRSGGEQFSGVPRSSDLLFRRGHLENRQPGQLASGDTGDVWLKLVLHMETKAPSGWVDGHGRPSIHAALGPFETPRPAGRGRLGEATPGLRVLSVDLGVRTFAACSVFELRERRPQAGLAFPAAVDGELWAVHDRSFLLRLPGEAPDPETIASRRSADDELRALRGELNRLRDLLRLGAVDDSDRRKAGLEALRAGAGQGSRPAIVPRDLAGLDGRIADDAQAWQEALRAVHRVAERRVGELVSQWRSRTRPRPADGSDRRGRRAYAGGKSVWAVQHLTAVRRFLQSWTLHGRSYAQIRRLDREKGGIFAAGLLEHINSLKEDRIKTGVDMIVQAARGYVPADAVGWVQRFAPCRVVLLEDLSRYLFRTDRPRRENSQLMQWAHRQILDECKMQAELYGLVVWSVSAAFSSRYHARSGAPGLRVHRVTAADLERPRLREILEERAEQAGIVPGSIAPGVLLPDPAGEQFATLGSDGQLIVLHADLNAAQNLQRRFWARYGEAYRIPAVELSPQGNSGRLWYPANAGKRQRGALAALLGNSGYARFEPAESQDGWGLRPVSPSHWRRATGSTAGSDAGQENADEEDGDVAALDAPESPVRGSRTAMFRDPSGHVLPADRWYPAKEFWPRVERIVGRALAERARAAGAPF